MPNIRPFETRDDSLDDLFRGFFMRPVRMEQAQVPQMKLDVSETETAYNVRAEIPGVKKENIDISIDGNHVSISAEVKEEKTEKEKNGERVLRKECLTGRSYRSFTLAQEVDDQSAEAKYTDGILTLTLPKKKAVTAKKLEIK